MILSKHVENTLELVLATRGEIETKSRSEGAWNREIPLDKYSAKITMRKLILIIRVECAS
jgi:hypothetical protein